MKVNSKLAAVAFLVITLVIVIRNFTGSRVITETILAMGTTARITIVVENPTTKKINKTYKALDEAFSSLKEREQSLSFYSPDSELEAINKSAGQGQVKISDLLLDVLEKSLVYCELTKGAFDITATSLQKEGGYGSIVLNSRKKTVYFKNKKTKIDLGGIATGFVIDEIAKRYEQLQIQNYLIDVGGDVYAHGVNEKGQPWQVGVRDPVYSERMIKKFSIKNQAVTTSGNYVKKHIVDPKTSSIAKSELLSVTVIAATCIDADVLATAFFIMGIDKTQAFIKDKRNDIKVLFVIDKQGSPEVRTYNWDQ